MKSSGMAKKAVLQDSQSSSRCFGFILQASSFILPEICSILFMSDDWAGQSWSTLTFSTFTDFGVEAEVWERAPSCWRICSLVVWNVMGSKNFLILRAVDVARSCRSLAHPHAGCNPKPWFFLPWTELFSGWILGPCRFQQVFCSISGDWDAVQSMIHQKNRPSATFPLSILSTSCRPWQMQHDSFGVFCFCFCWYVSSNSATETTAWGSLTNCFVDTGVSGDQFSRSSAAAEKGLTLDCRSNKRSSRTAGLVVNVTSFFKIFLSLPLDVWIHWKYLPPQQQTWSSGSWWSALWSVVESLACCQRFTWRSGALGFFLYTPGNVLITVFVTDGALICDWLNYLKTQQDFCPSKTFCPN